MNTTTIAAPAPAVAGSSPRGAREPHARERSRLPRDERERRAHRGVWTQRRRARTSTIRKQKKNQYLAHRRGLGLSSTTTTTNPTSPTVFPYPDLKSFLVAHSSPQNQTLILPPVTEQLVVFVEQCITQAQQQQQQSLSSMNYINNNNTSSSSDTNGPLLLLGTDEELLAHQFLQQLRQQAHREITATMAAAAAATQDTTTTPTANVLPCILKLLVQLTSLASTTTTPFPSAAVATNPHSTTTTTTTTQDTADYYGRSPSTWSRLLVQSSTVSSSTASWFELLLDILTRLLIARSNNNNNIDSTTAGHSIPVMAELTCLVIGNIMGDDTVTESMLFPSSLSFLTNTNIDGWNLMKATLIKRLIRTVSLFATTTATTAAAVAAATAALWTLTTLVRKDTVAPAAIYCAMEENTNYFEENNSSSNNNSSALFTPTLFIAWLQQPQLTIQTAWLLASLTGGQHCDYDTLCYLASPSSSSSSSSVDLLSVIVSTVHSILVVQQQQQQQQQQHGTTTAPTTPPNLLDAIGPLLQTLGNFMWHARFVSQVLFTPAAASSSCPTPPAPPLILTVLQELLTTVPSRNPILIEVAYLTGCLFVDYDASSNTQNPQNTTQQHPATIPAGPVLLHIVIDRLSNAGGGNNNNSSSSLPLTLEETREFAAAFQTALEVPPVSAVFAASSPAVSLMFQHGNTNAVGFSIPRALVETIIHRLIASQDGDAMYTGLSVINLILRRHVEVVASDNSSNHFLNVCTMLEEEQLPELLERICYEDDHNNSDDVAAISSATIAADLLDDFFYNTEDDPSPAQSTIKDASSNTNDWMSNNMFTMDQSQQPPLSFGLSPAVSSSQQQLGRGRGRGATLPAWMTNT